MAWKQGDNNDASGLDARGLDARGLDWSALGDATWADLVSSLANTNGDAKRDFLADPSAERPANEYGNLDAEESRAALSLLLDAKIGAEGADARIAEGDGGTDELELRLFRQVVERRIRQHELILACHDYHEAEAAGDAVAMRLAASRHRDLNQELFGLPDLNVLCAILARRRARAIARGNDDPALWERLVSALIVPADALDPQSGPVPGAPEPELLERLSGLVQEHFAGYLEHIPAGRDIFTVEEACDIANAILRDELPSADADWRAKIAPHAPTASVGIKRRVLRLPGARSRGDYTLADLRSILVHEIGVHIARSLSFDGFEPRVFSQGLPGYLRFEEGVAKVLEQAVNGTYEEAGTLHYLASGLAVHAHMGFRRVFDTAVEIERLAGGSSASVCFDSVQRAFRGTSVLPLCKDLVYHDGQALAWRFVEEHIDDPRLFELLLGSGKSDPTNPDHLAYVEAARKGVLGSWR